MYNVLCMDASVCLAFLLNENQADSIYTLLSIIDDLDIKIISPEFQKIEVLSVLRQKEQFGMIDQDEARELTNLYFDLNIEYHHVNEKLFDKMYRIARRLELPVIYDSLYLALAKQMKAIFLTEDKKFLKHVKEYYQNSYDTLGYLEKVLYENGG